MLEQINSLIYGVLVPAAFALLVVAVIVALVKSWLDWRKSKLSIRTRGKAEGVIFGKKGLLRYFSKTKNEGHVIVFGGSGSGKTSALLIPTLRSWNESSLTIDISGDISKNVDMPRKLIYEPDNPNSATYNAFASIDMLGNVDAKNEALEALALLLLPRDENANSASIYFQDMGRNILTASLVAFYHEGYDFTDICDKITGNSFQTLCEAIDNTKNEKAISYINCFQGVNDANKAGCLQEAVKAVQLFSNNETVKKSISRNARSEAGVFAPFKISGHNCFIVVPDAKLELYQPLLRMIVAQCFEFLSTRPAIQTGQILLCLDEFASFGRLEIVPALRKLRKKHVRIVVLTQSLADLDAVYGQAERKTMMDNFLFKVVLSASDVDTQEYFSKLIGYKQTKKTSVTRAGVGTETTSTTEHQERELAVEPAELARLNKKLILLHPNGWLKLRKNPYYSWV